MKKYLRYCLSALALALAGSAQAQSIKDLTITQKLDSTYVFGFDLRESRSAKGGIWNVKTGKPETPLNYTQVKRDTISGQPVVLLYREVALGNHPLNRWEAWLLKENKWIPFDEEPAIESESTQTATKQ